MTVTIGEHRLGYPGERPRKARQLAQAIEWLVFAYQGITLLQTAWINDFSLLERFIIIGLAVINFTFAVIVFMYKGLIGRNPLWMTTWAFGAVAVPAAVAVMAPHSAYAANDACVVACTYPAPMVLIISLYPWVFGALWLGQLAGPVLIAILLAEWVLLVDVLGIRFTSTAIQSILVSLMWLVAAYGIGLALRRIVDVWLKDRAELEQQNTESFFNFLHSHIKAGLAAVEHEVPDVEGMVEKLRDLQAAVGKERLRLLLSGGQIPLATVFSQHVQVFNDAINIKETPRVGGRTVSQAVGRLLDRALGDLLTNTVVHGAATARIRFSTPEGQLVLEILDDGPGFDNRVLDAQGKSLYDLRQSTRKLGGDLTRTSCESGGSHLILTVPEA